MGEGLRWRGSHQESETESGRRKQLARTKWEGEEGAQGKKIKRDLKSTESEVREKGEKTWVNMGEW